jgi:CheY-like chemotaxis protein
VLVVDDDQSTVDVFSRMLRLEGYEVVTASSADAALREVETSCPDAILVDLRMPGTDGLVFLRQLRAHEHPRHVPVAVITGDHAVDDAGLRELRELDAELHLKPVWLEDLLSITQALLQKTA